jgi:hypothetical protein
VHPKKARLDFAHTVVVWKKAVVVSRKPRMDFANAVVDFQKPVAERRRYDSTRKNLS